MKSYSIIRDVQYKELKDLILNGDVLDLGGSRSSGYHDLIGGERKIMVVNYGDMHPGEDLNFNIEERFPLQDNSYDNIITLNVLEHIFDYHNVFKESQRVLKSGGLFIASVPFMHHIHGSPDDYHRYTRSAFVKIASMHGFDIVSIKHLGYGLFSLIFQCVGGWVPTGFARGLVKNICTSLDRLLLNFKKYRELNDRMPLGYFVIMKKK